MIKDGQERARSPLIGGYYGSYTGHKAGYFSVSYNVRETVMIPGEDNILPNLERSLMPDYIPLWILI
jgi:hypothetical protein